MDLNKVVIREIEYEDSITLEKEIYKNTPILGIDKVKLHFSIKKDINQDFILRLNSSGIFILEDARTLEPVEYPFEVSFEEKLVEDSEFYARFLINSQNTLDILAILWENIVLEIPISYTVSKELQNSDENGYAIVGKENNDKIDPRLAPLLELLDKEKE